MDRRSFLAGLGMSALGSVPSTAGKLPARLSNRDNSVATKQEWWDSLPAGEKALHVADDVITRLSGRPMLLTEADLGPEKGDYVLWERPPTDQFRDVFREANLDLRFDYHLHQRGTYRFDEWPSHKPHIFTVATVKLPVDSREAVISAMDRLGSQYSDDFDADSKTRMLAHDRGRTRYYTNTTTGQTHTHRLRVFDDRLFSIHVMGGEPVETTAVVQSWENEMLRRCVRKARANGYEFPAEPPSCDQSRWRQ